MIPYLDEIGMLFMGGVFMWAGIDHFLRFKEVVSQLESQGFPAPRPLLAAGSIVEIVAGACLAIGIARPYSALALGLFTIVASVMILDFWRHSGAQREAMRSAFVINIAVVGGLMVAAASTG
ncbi:MAG: DoxX family protein [Mesorhizobium sp.]